MGSLQLGHLRIKYPDESDAKIAEIIAKDGGYIVIVRYKNTLSASDFTDFGTCVTEEEVQGYFSSPYCHDTEIVYDIR